MRRKGWKECTFGELIRDGALMLSDGYRAKNEELGGEGPIFLRAGHVTDTHVNFTGAERFQAELSSKVSGKMSKPGDVVITSKGNSTGRVTYVTPDMPPFVYSPHLSFWRSLKELLTPSFLRYWSRGSEFRGQLAAMACSTDMAPYISLVDQRRLTITLPPPDEQAAIGSTLGALDDKIELNRRMNETLEAMARAIFKSWFVDFDPVKARAAGRKPPGLDPATAALFPAAFQDSPLGPIPKGWPVSTFGETFDLTMGQSPPGETYNEAGDGLPFFQGSTDFGYRFPERRVYCTAPTRFAEPGDTLVSVRAPVGELNMVSERCSIGRGVAAIRHKSGSRSYSYYAMGAFREDFAQFEAGGTVFGCIGKADFLGLRCLAPPAVLVRAFEQAACALDKRIQNNDSESRTLAAIRDALLPKLLSGEVRVRQGDILSGATP
jgi:type I restriction enzyme S subunit